MDWWTGGLVDWWTGWTGGLVDWWTGGRVVESCEAWACMASSYYQYSNHSV